MTAKRRGVDLTEEDRAVVKSCCRDRVFGISDSGTTAHVLGVRAAHGPRSKTITCGGPECSSNQRGVDESEIGEVSPREVSSAAYLVDEQNSVESQDSAFNVASQNLRRLNIAAIDYSALIEVEWGHGDVGDGDGGGTGIGDVQANGIGGGPNSVVEPNDLETRDGLEGEGPRSGGGEIVHGGYCEGV